MRSITSLSKAMYEEDLDVKTLIDTSRELEGLPRHATVHAAGVVNNGKQP